MNKNLVKCQEFGERLGFSTIKGIRRVTKFVSQVVVLVVGGIGMSIVGFGLGLMRIEGKDASH